jgi:hypothetical protein
MKPYIAAAVLALAALTQNPTQAQTQPTFAMTAQGATAVPGGSTQVTFNFASDTSIRIASFASLLNYDPLLTLNAWSTTYHGDNGSAALTDVMANYPSDVNAGDSLWLASPQTPYLALGGPAYLSFSFNFKLAPNAEIGRPAPVTFSIEDASDGNASFGTPNVSLALATANITTPVPEPDTWLLTLVGLSMIGTIVRRKGVTRA